jgi:hypothetical protein
LAHPAAAVTLAAMKPVVILIPLALVAGGIALFYLLPTLPMGVRLFIMISEFAAAGLLGWLLWRRTR